MFPFPMGSLLPEAHAATSFSLSLGIGAGYDFGQVWYGEKYVFTTLQWEVRDLSEVRSVSGGVKVIQGLSRKDISWEKTSYFKAVPPPTVGGPKMNPYFLEYRHQTKTQNMKPLWQFVFKYTSEKVFISLKHIILILTVFIQFLLERAFFTRSERTQLE